MKTLIRLLCAVPAALVLLAGCSKNDQVVAPTSGDPSALQASAAAELARHPELVDDGTFESQTQASATSVGTSAIDPLFFWRQINRVERTYDFSFADSDSTGQPTTAVVTVHKRLSGWFNIVAGDPTGEGSPTEGHLVRKPLVDHWVRRILLKRVDLMSSARRPWRVAATSGVRITSRDDTTHIQSVRVQSGDLDTTISEPLAFWRLRRILKLAPNAEVTLTATTRRDDDVVVFYAGDRRTRFRNNGDGTYTLVWTVPALAGVRHLGVNALSHGTLYDDAAPYDSQAWILPYVVTPTELADLAP
jgi:hypothetical protein